MKSTLQWCWLPAKITIITIIIIIIIIINIIIVHPCWQ